MGLLARLHRSRSWEHLAVRSAFAMSIEDMQDVLANAMVLFALLLGLCVSVFSTSSMTDLMLFDYRCALLYKDGFREFVARHLEHKNFNFTQEIPPNVTVDLRELLLHPPDRDVIPSGFIQLAYGERTRAIDFLFHMTKDAVEPWVMGTVAQSPEYGSAMISWYNAVTCSMICFCLLAAFFNYTGLTMSDLSERRKFEEREREDHQREDAKLPAGAEARPSEGQRTDKAVESGRAGRQMDPVGWYIYILGWLMLIACITALAISFQGMGYVARSRYPQLAAWHHDYYVWAVQIQTTATVLGGFSGIAFQFGLGWRWWRDFGDGCWRCLTCSAAPSGQMAAVHPDPADTQSSKKSASN